MEIMIQMMLALNTQNMILKKQTKISTFRVDMPHLYNNNEDDDEKIKNSISDIDKFRQNMILTAGFIMLLVIAIFLTLGLNSCTINQTMIHTEGTASDVVDETATTNAQVNPELELSLPIL